MSYFLAVEHNQIVAKWDDQERVIKNIDDYNEFSLQSTTRESKLEFS